MSISESNHLRNKSLTYVEECTKYFYLPEWWGYIDTTNSW